MLIAIGYGAVMLGTSGCPQRAALGTQGVGSEPVSAGVNLDDREDSSLPDTTVTQADSDVAEDITAMRKTLNVELIVIDLSTCSRCVPTEEQLSKAIELLRPVAEELGIDLQYSEVVVQTVEEAKTHALLSSPTIRLNGSDIAQDIRESECESCGDLTENNTLVDCREWHYRGEVYTAAPLPMLIEEIMQAMITIDELPMNEPVPLDALPENLQQYFDNKKQDCCNSSCCG